MAAQTLVSLYMFSTAGAFGLFLIDDIFDYRRQMGVYPKGWDYNELVAKNVFKGLVYPFYIREYFSRR